MATAAIWATLSVVGRDGRSNPPTDAGPEPPLARLASPAPEPARDSREVVRVEAPSDPVPEALVEAPAAVEAVAVSEEGTELWEALYAGATLGELIDERRALQASLDDVSDRYYERAWAVGNFEVAAAERTEQGGYRIPQGFAARDDLASVRLDAASGEVHWVTLPRETFAEQYVARDRIAWLMKREGELEKLPPAPARR